ncbi:24121_t:CDS:1, partial [Gigaspora rosea]
SKLELSNLELQELEHKLANHQVGLRSPGPARPGLEPRLEPEILTISNPNLKYRTRTGLKHDY